MPKPAKKQSAAKSATSSSKRPKSRKTGAKGNRGAVHEAIGRY